MNTARRRQLIEQMLRSRSAQSQHEIAAALSARGISITQATISRDLAALGALKGSGGYVLADTGNRSDGETESVLESIRTHSLSIRAADSIVVIRTNPGHANVLGAAIDMRLPTGVIGCIAGDDTLFLAATSRAVAQRLATRLTRAQNSEH
ncbi:MAG: arginine repressor [Phycisphaeraceae bacterium]|nr:hypothetical protein [Phycisphaerales bacterium]MCB9844263.1 arginine repressor [Phycisphaeraceae bacterium]